MEANNIVYIRYIQDQQIQECSNGLIIYWTPKEGTKMKDEKVDQLEIFCLNKAVNHLLYPKMYRTNKETTVVTNLCDINNP